MSKVPYTIIKTLKTDTFGVISLATYNNETVIIRDISIKNKFKKIITKILNNNEVKILKRINRLNSPNLPKLIHSAPTYTIRSYLSGTPINQFPTKLNEAFFAKAFEIIQMMHQQGIVHNDLEKPENWVVMDNGEPGFIDFQLAKYFPKKTFLFKQLQKVEIRHVIKCKKRFCTSPLSASEIKILNNRGSIHKLILRFLKPIYNFVTRNLFKYSDRKSDQYYD